jgi:antitoxin component of MazEF toxin-antitoxin module
MDRSKTPGPVLQALGVRGGDRLVYHIAEDGTVTVTAKRAEQTADAEAA